VFRGILKLECDQWEHMLHSGQPRTSRTSFRSAGEVLLVSLRLGCTSFGGPIVHLGYFRDAYVVRRKWVSEEAFADLVALCQFLPGPASSQVNMSIGMARAGIAGLVAAWIGFTLPSAAALTAFAYLVGVSDVLGSGWLHGIMVAAVAVVAQAVWSMASRFAADPRRASIAVAAAIASLLLPMALTQLVLIVVGGFVGRLLLVAPDTVRSDDLPLRVNRGVSIACLALFVVLLVGLPVLRSLVLVPGLALVESFYRVGSLVFGGGHVVLPLLHREVVLTGWITDAQFLAGYGAAQAVPGPLFTFAAYLGALMRTPPNGIIGGLMALAAIFLPSFLLLLGVLPFWASLRTRPGIQSALAGINATVVGLLAAALYSPVWTGAIASVPDFCIALGAFALLSFWKARPWMVVALGAAAGAAIRL
jgi:chromate transporter